MLFSSNQIYIIQFNVFKKNKNNKGANLEIITTLEYIKSFFEWICKKVFRNCKSVIFRNPNLFLELGSKDLPLFPDPTGRGVKGAQSIGHKFVYIMTFYEHEAFKTKFQWWIFCFKSNIRKKYLIHKLFDMLYDWSKVNWKRWWNNYCDNYDQSSCFTKT